MAEIEVRNIDATTADYPNSNLLVHLYHPFQTPLTEQVLSRLEAAYEAQPRRIDVAYLLYSSATTPVKDVFSRFGWLREVRHEQSVLGHYDWLLYSTEAHVRRQRVGSRAMGVRLEPADEYMHELGPEPNFNESMYFNVFDPENKIGGFFRIGNRANEGYAEMTVCLYLPDGRVGFMFKRAEIANNDAFDAGGHALRRSSTPFEELRVTYDGKVVLLDDPTADGRPEEGLHREPVRRMPRSTSTFTGQGRPSMFGGEPDEPHETPGEEFAKGHYEQLVAGKGRIRVGEREWLVVGFGLRDHSWGPRYWQAPWYYRWLTANVGRDFGFMGSRVARRDGDGTRGGFVWEDGEAPPTATRSSSRPTYEGDDQYHDAISAVLRSSRSEKEWKVSGRVMNLIPLRNRRPDPDGNMLVTRISEGMTEWTLDDGRVGYGLSEYLDQIIDGAPVGLDE